MATNNYWQSCCTSMNMQLNKILVKQNGAEKNNNEFVFLYFI